MLESITVSHQSLFKLGLGRAGGAQGAGDSSGWVRGLRSLPATFPALPPADLFDILLPMLNIYQEFVRNHQYSLQILAHCKQNRDFDKLLKHYEAKPDCEERTLETFLTYPMFQVSPAAARAGPRDAEGGGMDRANPTGGVVGVRGAWGWRLVVPHGSWDPLGPSLQEDSVCCWFLVTPHLWGREQQVPGHRMLFLLFTQLWHKGALKSFTAQVRVSPGMAGAAQGGPCCPQCPP